MRKNKISSIFARIMAFSLAVILFFGDFAMYKTYAADMPAEEGELTSLSEEEISALLLGEDGFNVTFSPETEAAFTQTMSEISRLMEAGQLVYNESTGMLTVTDPNADLSGLNISDLEKVTNPDGSTSIVANVGTVSEEDRAGAAVIGETLRSGGDAVMEEEPAEEEPAEEEPVKTPAPEESAEEEDAEQPAEEEDAEGASVGEPAEEEAEEQVPAETEEGDGISDEEAELQGLFDCCDRKETKANNVPCYNTYKSGRKKRTVVPAKNTVVNVIDSKRNGIWPFGDLYYLAEIDGIGTYWIHSDNLKDHKCTASGSVTKTYYKQISDNNDKHNKIEETDAQVCKCGCVVSEYKKKTKKEDHSWNSLGVCTSCGYDFKEKKDNVTDKIYMVNGNGVKLHSAPYGAAPTTRTLNSTDSVKVTHEAKNAFHSFFSPRVWYLTDAGDWIYSDNAKKHKHSYDEESSKTGKCTVCRRIYGYDIIPESDTAYEVAVTYNVPIRKYPYSKADAVAYTNENNLYTVDAHTYPDPNGSYWSRGDKWYRLKGLGWVKYSDMKEHVTHKYNQSSGGVCRFVGCSEEFVLKTKYFATTPYETRKANVVARNQPYSIGTIQQTYKYGCTLVQIEGEVVNSLKETWYRTVEDYWIKASDLKVHDHILKVGACTTVGCSYVAKENTFACKKYTGEIFKATELKEKPFADSKTVKALPASSCLTINGVCTVEGKVWYRTASGCFVDSSCLKKHSHNYQNGYCAACNGYKEWTTSNIDPMVVLSKADNTVIREKPYEAAPVKRTLSKNEEIVINKKGVNCFGHTWYQLVDGTWIYSKNVKSPKGSEVKPTNKLSVDKFTLTIVDDCGDPIEGAEVEWVGQIYPSDADGKVTLAYVTTKTDFKITCKNYDDVILKDHTMSSSRKQTVTMALKGSYRATEVIMNYLNKDINILRTSKNLNKYHTQGIFQKDFTITCKMSEGMASRISKYELVQGTDVIQTSKDGKFTGLDVGDFANHKTVFLKVYDKNNKMQSKQELRLNIFNEGLDGISPSLQLGLGRLVITLPAAAPLVGGLEIKIEPDSLIKVTVDIDDDSTKYALEINPSEDRVTSIGAYKDYWDKIKSMKKSGWQDYFNKEQVKGAGKGPKWEVSIGGYAEKIHGEDTVNGKIYISLSVKVGTEKQMTVPPAIPILLGVSFKGKGTVGANFTMQEGQITDFTVPLDISIAVEVTAGVGIKHIADVSVFGQASLGLEFQLYPFDGDETNIFLRASMGLRGRALGAEIFRFTFLESPIIYIVQEGEFVLWEEDPYAAMMEAGNYTPISRSYLQDRSGWYEPGVELMDEVNVSISDMDVKVLQSNTYTDLRPQVVTADDGTIMMLFTDDNASRADIDRTMLVFSLYNPKTGMWTEPRPVQDDGTGDYGFSAHSVGSDIYLVWQNAKTTHAADADITAVSRALEVTVAKYDNVAQEFVCIETLTDNDVYENMPRISAVNGQVVVSWFTNSEHDMFQTSGQNTVWYATKTEADYDSREPYSEEIDFSEITEEEIEVPVEEESDESYEDPEPGPWVIASLTPTDEVITSMAVGYMLESGYVAYTTDEDGNTNTVEDQFIRLIDAATGTLTAYTDKACNVEFTRVHGDNAMTWYNQGTIYYALHPDYAPMMLMDEEIVGDVNLGDEYQIISDDQGNMAILSTRNGDNCSNAYIMLYDNENFQWGIPVAVTQQDLYIRDFFGAYHEGTIVSIFNRSALNEKTYEESNSLCSAIINQRIDLAISEAYVDTYGVEPLADVPVTLTVTNNGTSRVEGFTLNLYDAEENLLSTSVSDTVLRMGQSAMVEMKVTMGESVEQRTYRLEVIANDGSEDDHPDNNEHYFDVGVPRLTLEAENQSTETEDIVVLRVTNAGYGELGGKLVLLDDSGAVSETIVEEFAPIDHEGEYTCAVLFSDEYFHGEPNAVFCFGIIPAGETEVFCETSIYVDKVRYAENATVSIEGINLSEDDADASLMEVTEKSVSGTVRNDTEKDLADVLLCASAYDVNGVWLDSYTQNISLLSEESYSFTAVFLTDSDIESVTVTLLNSETMEPLVSAQRITLTYDIIFD